MNPDIPARAAKILDFIAHYESRGNYRAYFGHAGNTEPLPATLGAVLQFQRQLVEVRHLGSSATGRYQFMPATLRALVARHRFSLATPFTDDFQDMLAFALLRRRGYDTWCAGKISNSAFADALSEEWASLPDHTGASFYGGDGLNEALVSRADVMALLAVAAKLPAMQPHPPVAQPPTAPAAASPSATASSPATAPTETRMNGILGTLGLVLSGVKTFVAYAPQLPSLEKKLGDVVMSGGKLVADIEGLIGDVESGRYGDVATAAGAIFADLEGLFEEAGGISMPLVASTVAKAPTLPSVAGLQAAKEAA